MLVLIGIAIVIVIVISLLCNAHVCRYFSIYNV